MKDAVILIPSYEPDDKLISLVSSLRDDDFPILVVNDGSNASFDSVFERIKDKVKYLSYKDNRGKGYALRFGYAQLQDLYPSAKYVITVDGDGQHSIEDINKVYLKLCETNKIVLGTRNLDKDIPPKSKFGNWYSKVNRSWLTKQYLSDDQCGLRGYPVSYIPDLLKMSGDRYEYEMNQIVKLQMMHADIVTVPIKTIYEGGKNSTTHFAPFKDTLRIHSFIALHSIPAIICNFLLISLILVGFTYLDLPRYASIYLSYFVSTCLYLLLINIIYRVKSKRKCFGVELLAMLLHMLIAHLLLWLTIDIFYWNYIAITPFVVVLVSMINVLLAWFLHLIKNIHRTRLRY